MAIKERTESINLFNGAEALTLLHISDIHLWYSTGILKQLQSIVERICPDLIVCTGDYFDIPKGAYLFRAFLEKISIRVTVVFIRGNHDFVYGRRIADLVLGIPNCYCVEDMVYSYVSKRRFTYNFTSWKCRNALSNKKAGRNVVLIHNPEKIKEKELDNIHLIVAGHLHGGQFIFFTSKDSSHYPGRLMYRYCADRRVIGNTVLIVSKGVGDTFPVRMNCGREVVRIEIR